MVIEKRHHPPWVHVILLAPGSRFFVEKWHLVFFLPEKYYNNKKTSIQGHLPAYRKHSVSNSRPGLCRVVSWSRTQSGFLFSVTTKEKQIQGHIRSTHWQLVSAMSRRSRRQLSTWLSSSFLSDTDPSVFVSSFTVNVGLSVLLPVGTLSVSVTSLSLALCHCIAVSYVYSWAGSVNFISAFGI